MKIAYLLPDPGIPVGGTKGASVHVSSLCKALVANGAQVTLFAPTVVGPAPVGVRLVHVDIGRVASGPKGERERILAMGSFYENVRSHLEIEPTDIIHERLSLFGGAGTLLARQLGVARQVEVNAPVADERAKHFGLSETAAAYSAEREALDGARTLVVSAPLARWAKQKGAQTALVLPNGAEIDALDPAVLAGQRQRMREYLQLSDLPTVGFVGSLKPWHGLDVLLEALAELGKDRDLAALIVGDGPGKDGLISKAAKLPSRVKIVITGAIAPHLVPDYLSVIDVAVAPYTPMEPFYFSPLKVAEAMAGGLAVVASDFESVRDLLGSTGQTVAPGNSSALAKAVADLLDDPEKRSQLGRKARERAVELLDWRTVGRMTLNHARSTRADHRASQRTPR